MRKPPWIPHFFLKILAPSEIREFFLGDIEEQFQMLVADQDEQDANRWFWKQTVNSIFPLLNLTANKNLRLSVFRVIAFFVVVIPVIASSPLKDSGIYYSFAELMGLLFAACALGFLCRLIIQSIRSVTSILFTLVIFTLCLVIRGEWQDLTWMLIPITIFVSIGTGLALIAVSLNSPNPKIRT